MDAAQDSRGPFIARDADFYDLTVNLTVNRERRLILAMTATYEGQVFARTALSTLQFDAPLPEVLFQSLATS